MMSPSLKASRAFTLIETVIVAALSASMMLVLGLLIFHFNKISDYDKASALSSGSASALMREIVSFVAPAKTVLGTHTFAGGDYSSSPTTLVLEIPSIDSAGVVITNTYDYVAFYVTGTSAYRLLEADPSSSRVSGTKLLSTTIDTLSFDYDNVDFAQVTLVTVDIQTLATVKQDVISDHRNEQVRLRNH